MKPLAERVTESLFQIAAEYEEALKHEADQHHNTLDLLQRLKRGEVSLDEVAVTDSGWRLIPPEPKEPSGGNGASDPNLRSTPNHAGVSV